MQFFQIRFQIHFACLLLFVGFHELSAQQIIAEQYIPIKGYDNHEVGYPFGIVPVSGGRFAFVQYWTQSKMHPVDNFYLQCLSSSDFEGLWYQQVIENGRDRFQIGEVLRVGKSIVVTGSLYLPTAKTYQTVFRYFDLDGKPLHNGAIQISDWVGKTKTVMDESFHASPNNKYLLWMGKDDKDLHCSVWDDEGNKLWSQVLTLPHIAKKYVFKDVTLTNEGYPLFLLEHHRPSYTLKDTVYPPLLVRYHPKREKYHTDSLHLDSAFAIHTQIKLLNNQELIVAGVYGQEDPSGLPNGAKINKKPQIWNGFFFKKLLLVNTDSTRVLADSLSPMAQDWIEHYGEEGSNFSDFKIEAIESKKGVHALLLMEEMYADKKRVFFYDVGCISFDLSKGNVNWVKRLQKRQRGQGGASLLSYLSDITTNNIHFIYLSERGAKGKLMSTSFSLADGRRRDFTLASNEAATYLFFPKSSGKIANATVVLIGMGNPGQNDYKLMTIRLE
jgi:hypothetical protein